MKPATVIQLLKQQIASGDLIPNSRLPSERALSKRFSCSRQVIREALTELRSTGVIETRHGSGSSVRNLVEAPARDAALDGLYTTFPRVLYDILEARQVLESKAAYFAAARATARDRYRIDKTFQALHKNPSPKKSPEKHSEADFAFHQAIADAAQSPVLAHTLQGLSHLFAKTVRASVDNLYGRAAERRKINDQHRVIFEAIMAGDPLAAETAAHEHIQSVRDSLERIEQAEKELIRN